jgi:hypothetical protein
MGVARIIWSIHSAYNRDDDVYDLPEGEKAKGEIR